MKKFIDEARGENLTKTCLGIILEELDEIHYVRKIEYLNKDKISSKLENSFKVYLHCISLAASMNRFAAGGVA